MGITYLDTILNFHFFHIIILNLTKYYYRYKKLIQLNFIVITIDNNN